MTIERPYAGQLAHQRASVRRAALVEAGLELLGTEGVHATTVRAVCRTAGLNSRYFYESFANIDELLVEVFDHVLEGGISDALAQLPQADGDLRKTISAVGHAFVGMLDDPRATRVALIEAWGNEALMRRRVATLHAGAAMLAAAVKEGKRGAPDNRTVELAAFTIMGGLLESMLAWVDGALDMPRDQLIESFTDLAVATMERALNGP